jgi:plastocyanin
MSKRRLAVTLAIVAVAGLGTACGDSGSGSGSGSGTDTGDTKTPVKLTGTTNSHGSKDVSGKDDVELEVELDNFYFSPTFVKATAGQSIKVALTNEGSAPHTFTVDGGPDEQLAPKAKKTVTVTAPSSGVLVYYCRFHQGQGMQGAFYLKEGDSGGSSNPGSSGSSSTTPTTYGY